MFYLVDFAAKRYFSEYYVISWGIQNHYWHVWVIPAVFALFHKPIIAAAMTAGHPIGLFLGQYLGNMMKMRNMGKITPGMTNEELYHLQRHMGVWLWLCTLLISMAAGILVTFWRRQRKKRRKN